MPDLDRFYREAGDKAAILAVAPAGDEGGMRDLIKDGPYSLPVMLDEGGVASDYNIRYVPTLHLIDSQGDIAERVVGAVDFDRLNQMVGGLTGE
jgi:hypothetical protein